MGLNPPLKKKTHSVGDIIKLIGPYLIQCPPLLILETKSNEYSNIGCFEICQKSVTNFLIYLSINFECFPEKTPKIIYGPEYYLPLSLTQVIESSGCRRKARQSTAEPAGLPL